MALFLLPRRDVACDGCISCRLAPPQEHGSEVNPPEISAAALRNESTTRSSGKGKQTTRRAARKAGDPVGNRGEVNPPSGLKAMNARGAMEDAFSPEGKKPGRTAAVAAGGGGGGTGREGTARGFASTGSGQRRVRPCSGTVQRGNGSGGYSQLAAQPVGPAPHHLTAPRGEEESGERERLSRTAASMGVAMCSVGRTARKRAGLGGD
jgi:hypothetical protein